LCNLALAWRTLRRRRVHVRLNKIEFSYLNSNLMVLKLHPLTLNSDRNRITADHKGRQRLFNRNQQ
jgi:hypothetical protein